MHSGLEVGIMYVKDQRLPLANWTYKQVRKDIEVAVAPKEEVEVT